MHFGQTNLSVRGLVITLAMVAFGVGAEAADAGKAPGQSIIVSTPKGGTTGAEVNQLGTGQYDAKALSGGSLDSFNQFSSQSSLSGLMAPPPSGPATVIQGGGMDDLLDKQKDWMFLSPEELILGLTPREAAVMQGSKRANDDDRTYLDQTLPPAARFYESLVRQENKSQPRETLNQDGRSQNDLFGTSKNFTSALNYGMQNSGLTTDFNPRSGAGGVMGAAIDGASFQKALEAATAGKNDFSSLNAARQASGLFGLGPDSQTSGSDSSLPDPNNYVAQFKALLNPQAPAAAPVPAPVSYGNAPSAEADSGLAPGFGVVATPTQVKTYNPGWSNPALLRSTIPTVGATAEGQTGFGVTPSDTAGQLMQPQTFTMPKRWF